MPFVGGLSDDSCRPEPVVQRPEKERLLSSKERLLSSIAGVQPPEVAWVDFAPIFVVQEGGCNVFGAYPGLPDFRPLDGRATL